MAHPQAADGEDGLQIMESCC